VVRLSRLCQCRGDTRGDSAARRVSFLNIPEWGIPSFTLQNTIDVLGVI